MRSTIAAVAVALVLITECRGEEYDSLVTAHTNGNIVLFNSKKVANGKYEGCYKIYKRPLDESGRVESAELSTRRMTIFFPLFFHQAVDTVRYTLGDGRVREVDVDEIPQKCPGDEGYESVRAVAGAAPPRAIQISNSADVIGTTPDGRFTVVGGVGAKPLSVVDNDQHEEVSTFTSANLVSSVAVGDDGATVLALFRSDDGTVSVIRRFTLTDAGLLVDSGLQLDLGGSATNSASSIFIAPGSAMGFALRYVDGANPGRLSSFTVADLSVKDSVQLALGSGNGFAITCDGEKVFVRSGDRASHPDVIEGFTFDAVTGALGDTPFLTIPGVTGFTGTSYVNSIALTRDSSGIMATESNPFQTASAPQRVTFFNPTTGGTDGVLQNSQTGEPGGFATLGCGAAGASPAVFTSGDGVPGAGQTDGPPASAKFTGFGVPAIDGAGGIAFTALWTSPAGKGSGLFAESNFVARVGGPTGISSRTFRSFGNPIVAPDGSVAFTAKLQGSGVRPNADDAAWTNAFGALAPVLREGEEVPGLPTGVKLKSIASLSLGDGALVALIKLRPAAGLVRPGVNDTVLLWLNGAAAGTKLLRTGEAIPSLSDSPVKTITTLTPSPRSPGQARWHGAASVLARVVLQNKTSAVLNLAADGTPTILAVAGGDGPDAVPESRWAAFGLPAADGSGNRVALLGMLARGKGAVNSTNDSAIVFAENGAPFTLIAHKGDKIIGEAKFAAFNDPVVNDNGEVLFQATLAGPGVTARNRVALFSWLQNGEAVPLARLNDAPPDESGTAPLTGVTWSQFVSYALPGGTGAGPVFIAKMAGHGITARNNLGLWAVDSTGLVRLLARTGGPVASFTLLNSLPPGFSEGRAYNAKRAIALRVVFTDRSQALAQVGIP